MNIGFYNLTLKRNIYCQMIEITSQKKKTKKTIQSQKN